MAADNASWLKPILDFAEREPFSGGFILGAILSAFTSVVLAKQVGLKGYEGAVKEWKGMNEALKREMQEIKKQLHEKDERIHICHNEIKNLRGQLANSGSD